MHVFVKALCIAKPGNKSRLEKSACSLIIVVEHTENCNYAILDEGKFN
jgi:hypothetical protein